MALGLSPFSDGYWNVIDVTPGSRLTSTGPSPWLAEPAFTQYLTITIPDGKGASALGIDTLVGFPVVLIFPEAKGGHTCFDASATDISGDCAVAI